MKMYLIRAPRNTWILVSTSHPFPTSTHVPLPTRSLHDNQRNLLKHKSDYPILIPVTSLPLFKDETPIPNILKALQDWSLQPEQPQVLAMLVFFLLFQHAGLSLSPPHPCGTLSMFTWPPHTVWNVLTLGFVWLVPAHLSNFSMIIISSKKFLLTLLGRSDPPRIPSSSFLWYFLHM